MEAFEIKNLTFTYPKQDIPALNDITLTVKSGEFLVVCGPSGCGKSTLLRHLKTVLSPQGSRSGSIYFRGAPLEEAGLREQSSAIGFIQQSAEDMIVTDKVWHEMAFGLESLGLSTPVIRRRVAETASFFGIQTWFRRSVNELSGGQKQLLSLASVMVMQPDIIILDEPCGQLDPIAAYEFTAMLGRINRELGTTVIIAEHRLENVLPLAARTVLMENGRIVCAGPPAETTLYLKKTGSSMSGAMPAAVRIWAAVENSLPCPLTVQEGRSWLQNTASERTLGCLPRTCRENVHPKSDENVLKASDIGFRYSRSDDEVINGLSIALKRGEILAILGGNGTGKSTCLKLLAGVIKPQRGRISVNGRAALLPQNPKSLFVKNTLFDEFAETARINEGKSSGNVFFDGVCSRPDEKALYAAELCGLTSLLDRHPYDLSGGEQQRAAFAEMLLTGADIMLLDEPTKGLDSGFCSELAALLKRLSEKGISVVMVSHDVEFCAEYADRCAMLFDGSIASEAPARDFFRGNSFYTTAASRIARGICDGAVTCDDVIYICGGHTCENEYDKNDGPRRKTADGASCGMTCKSDENISGKCEPEDKILKKRVKKEGCLYNITVNIRKNLPLLCVMMLVPATIAAGEMLFGGRKYYFISLLILLECMLPFFVIFEKRKPGARELVLIAALCAAGVAGRAAFFMLPQFKPVLALVIISGAALGAGTGFLTGAVTMLVSNMFFGQGPWTPWQMFAMGLPGFLAGFLFGSGIMKGTRLKLSVYGILCAVIIYGAIMNFSSALLGTGTVSLPVLISYCAAGFPMDCVHAFATAVFLWFGGPPMLEKLERIRIKYGIIK